MTSIPELQRRQNSHYSSSNEFKLGNDRPVGPQEKQCAVNFPGPKRPWLDERLAPLGRKTKKRLVRPNEPTVRHITQWSSFPITPVFRPEWASNSPSQGPSALVTDPNKTLLRPNGPTVRSDVTTSAYSPLFVFKRIPFGELPARWASRNFWGRFFPGPKRPWLGEWLAPLGRKTKTRGVSYSSHVDINPTDEAPSTKTLSANHSTSMIDRLTPARRHFSLLQGRSVQIPAVSGLRERAPFRS